MSRPPATSSAPRGFGGRGALGAGPPRERRGPFAPGAFTSALHDERIAAWLGLALGACFGACFVTGVLSHLIQHPPGWFEWPPRPAGLYRVTQGVHVFTGLAAIPLLLAKLWTVYPHLWRWPPVTDVRHLIERVSLVPLVAGSLFMVATGTMNIAYWYPWGFFFPTAHYWGAWITMGALVVHVGAKAPATARSFRRRDHAITVDPGRRAFMGAVAATSGLVLLTTIGETIPALRKLAVLAPRRLGIGPQGLPVNKSAAAAGVPPPATGAATYRLVVDGRVTMPLELTLADLVAMPAREVALPIACVEGWSVQAMWRGIAVAVLLERAGAQPSRPVTVESLQPSGLYRSSVLSPSHAADPATLLALEVNGETLHIDHGFPVRLIGPNGPGVMQTKWVTQLTVG